MSDQSLLQLGLPAPHMPTRAASGRRSVLGSVLVHGSAAALLALITIGGRTTLPGKEVSPAPAPVQVPRIVFLQTPGPGGGGGGGGNRQPQPPSRAQGAGDDRITLPIARPVVVSPDPADIPAAPSVVLEAVPLASGATLLMGMPEAHPSLAFSQGPGSGGGVGDGTGTGVGAGKGPGLGPGTGGGSGGDVYRPGNGVVAPVLLTRVTPVYTTDAMRRKIQGTVTLEAVIGLDGTPTLIRVVRSLDASGLDAEAVRAARQWRFVPGHISGTPVEVLVHIVLDFRMH